MADGPSRPNPPHRPDLPARVHQLGDEWDLGDVLLVLRHGVRHRDLPEVQHRFEALQRRVASLGLGEARGSLGRSEHVCRDCSEDGERHRPKQSPRQITESSAVWVIAAAISVNLVPPNAGPAVNADTTALDTMLTIESHLPRGSRLRTNAWILARRARIRSSSS